MKRSKYLFLTIIVCLVWSLKNLPLIAQNAAVPDNYCISAAELDLFNKINAYRTERGLPELSLSRSLSYVAYLHVRDLKINRPDSVKGCNKHSWSGQGNWSAFCFPRDQSRKKSVWDKPKEITRYPGQGFELLYHTSDGEAIADDAMALWRSLAASQAILLNTGHYLKNKWKVVGVAMYKEYISVWFGEANDPETSVRMCHSDSIISSVRKTPAKNPTSGGIIREDVSRTLAGRYYLIFGSYNTLQQAREGQQRLMNDGFSDVKIMEMDGRFRTSIGDFATQEEARNARKKLPAKYKDAWILRE
ncbi:MAG: SPOR domain-containing protein [Bacteroidales bacterium]